MSIRSSLGAVRRGVISSLHVRTLNLAGNEPVVSFTFDDFPRSAFLTGGAILEEFGVRGTYYAAPGLMGTTNELGAQFVADDVHALIEKEHELATHTYGHISARSTSCAEYRANIQLGRAALAELTGVDSGNFSYPFGDVTLAVKKAAGEDLVSARSIFPGINGPQVDLTLLRANQLYGDANACARGKQLIEENLRRKGWLIFYTHDIQSTPTPYGCTEELLERVVSAAVQSGCRVMTIEQVLTAAGVQKWDAKRPISPNCTCVEGL